MMINRDGHIHTPFCKHGTRDALEDYIEECIRLGRKEISFTEHFPMPDYVTDPKFAAECAMVEEEIPDYFKAIEQVKEKYRNQIKINKGFEVDYFRGKESDIMRLLNQYGNQIEDSILSVHFVRYHHQYYAIDYEPQLDKLVEQLPSIEALYDLYYQTILFSIEANLGFYKPRRIGHPTLIRVFQKKYPIAYNNEHLFSQIAQTLKEKSYAIDFNVAGLRKPLCGETYPSGRFWEILQAYQIPFVYGSDSHQVSQLALLNEASVTYM